MSGKLSVAKGYTHYQTIPASSWIIAHNLNCMPLVQVYVHLQGVEQRTFPHEAIILDLNTMVIEFTQPQSGRVVLV